jgi:hypothetical protein
MEYQEGIYKKKIISLQLRSANQEEISHQGEGPSTTVQSHLPAISASLPNCPLRRSPSSRVLRHRILERRHIPCRRETPLTSFSLHLTRELDSKSLIALVGGGAASGHEELGEASRQHELGAQVAPPESPTLMRWGIGGSREDRGVDVRQSKLNRR